MYYLEVLLFGKIVKSHNTSEILHSKHNLPGTFVPAAEYFKRKPTEGSMKTTLHLKHTHRCLFPMHAIECGLRVGHPVKSTLGGVLQLP